MFSLNLNENRKKKEKKVHSSIGTAPGLVSTSHPSVADGIVIGTASFHWSSSCCHWSTNIHVPNVPPSCCYCRYCGSGGGEDIDIQTKVVFCWRLPFYGAIIDPLQDRACRCRS